MGPASLVFTAIVSMACSDGPSGADMKTQEDPEPGCSAEVLSAAPSRESPQYADLVVAFANPTGQEMRVVRYSVRWPGGERAFEPRGFVLGQGETRERRVRISPADGDVDGLLADPRSAEVEVTARKRGFFSSLF